MITMCFTLGILSRMAASIGETLASAKITESCAWLTM